MIDLTFSGIRTVYLLVIPETKDRSMEYVKTKTTKKRMGAKKKHRLTRFSSSSSTVSQGSHDPRRDEKPRQWHVRTGICHHPIIQWAIGCKAIVTWHMKPW